jgi:hypothetical protein
MIVQTYGIGAYSSTDPMPRPAAEKQPAQSTDQKNAEGSGFPADRTDLSAEALALSKNIRSATATSEQRETREESTPSPPSQTQNTRLSPPSINIRV